MSNKKIVIHCTDNGGNKLIAEIWEQIKSFSQPEKIYNFETFKKGLFRLKQSLSKGQN